MEYWSAIDIINQVSGEVGLPKVVTIFSTDDANSVQNNQLVAALNTAGNELGIYYPWEQFHKEFPLTLQAGVSGYALPGDWAYFVDQTQWDRTNGWPLLGPKSPAEWAWLKGGLVASFPRMRYRVMNDKIEFFPVPTAEFVLSMEYVSGAWVQGAGVTEPNQDRVVADGDVVWFNPWLMVKFTKLKWLQLKGFPSDAAGADFQRLYDSLKGKDVGAQVLSLVPNRSPFFIGPHSIPDGNWDV